MNTDNANRYLNGMQINDMSVWDSKDIEYPLDFLLEDYHQEQLKLLGIADAVKQNKESSMPHEFRQKDNFSGLCSICNKGKLFHKIKQNEKHNSGR